MIRNSENAGEVTRLRGLCEELAEGLSWALDCLDLDAVLLSEHVPDAWAGLDHAALHIAKAKARAALSDSVAVLRDTAPARECDCHLHEMQVCDICQGATGNEPDTAPARDGGE